MRNFSIAIANAGLNVAGIDCYGINAGITAFLADRYFNFVAPGTSVNFFTEGGTISPTARTDAQGLAVASLQTQGPAPQDVGPGAYYQCGFNTCLHPCTPERWATDLFYGPHHTYNPRDGVNTILVTAIEAEFYIDYNQNGRFDGPNGKWDVQIMIWTTISKLFTSSNARFSIYKVDSAGCDSPPATIDITGTGTNNFVLDLSDENFNPLDNISLTLASTTTTACAVSPTTAYSNADPNGQSWTHFEFTVTGKAAGPCEVDIAATWSNKCGSFKVVMPPLTGLAN